PDLVETVAITKELFPDAVPRWLHAHHPYNGRVIEQEWNDADDLDASIAVQRHGQILPAALSRDLRPRSIPIFVLSYLPRMPDSIVQMRRAGLHTNRFEAPVEMTHDPDVRQVLTIRIKLFPFARPGAVLRSLRRAPDVLIGSDGYDFECAVCVAADGERAPLIAVAVKLRPGSAPSPAGSALAHSPNALVRRDGESFEASILIAPHPNLAHRAVADRLPCSHPIGAGSCLKR